jgi:hypothetical protein
LNKFQASKKDHASYECLAKALVVKNDADFQSSLWATTKPDDFYQVFTKPEALHLVYLILSKLVPITPDIKDVIRYIDRQFKLKTDWMVDEDTKNVPPKKRLHLISWDLIQLAGLVTGRNKKSSAPRKKTSNPTAEEGAPSNVASSSPPPPSGADAERNEIESAAKSLAGDEEPTDRDRLICTHLVRAVELLYVFSRKKPEEKKRGKK